MTGRRLPQAAALLVGLVPTVGLIAYFALRVGWLAYAYDFPTRVWFGIVVCLVLIAPTIIALVRIVRNLRDNQKLRESWTMAALCYPWFAVAGIVAMIVGF